MKGRKYTRQRSHEIETLYRTAPVGMALVDCNRRCLKINQHFAAITGETAENHVGRPLKDAVPGLVEKIDRAISEVFERSEDILNLEVTLRVNGKTAQDFLIDIYPYEEDGRVTAVCLLIKEVTELRHLEKELRRLMDELQHRVKNTLATVASIVNQTVSTKSDRTELVDTLKKRLGALAATHDLLTLHDWQGASLRQILETELRPFDHRDRIKLSGPVVDLPPKHALSLTLTLHELATNAAKYRAVSQAGGKLNIDWAVNVDASGRRLTLSWLESGVNGVSAIGITESF